MYGKHFSSMYEGSMVGSGAHVFAVWGYCIANADPDTHTVRLNPSLLAAILGEEQSKVEQAIEFLSSPDERSHCTDHEGRRLVCSGGLEYLVVSHHIYRNINNGKDRRAYIREYMRKYRLDKDVNSSVNSVNSVNFTKFTPVSVSASESASASASPEGDARGSDFDAFWTAYPRKVGKIAARHAWRKAKDKPDLAVVLTAIESQKAGDAWRRDGGQYIPHPATWLNQGRWDDDPSPAPVGPEPPQRRRSLTDFGTGGL